MPNNSLSKTIMDVGASGPIPPHMVDIPLTGLFRSK